MKRKTVDNWYQVNNQAAVPEILIFGYIGPWDDIDYIGFEAQIKELAKNYTSVKVRIHSGGGSVIDGLPIYDALMTSGLEREIVIEGMAASMASVLSQAASPGKRLIQKNGTIMIHRVKGAQYGNADDLRAYADLVEDREKRIKQIFVKSTSQDAPTVDGWFEKNTDWWINAEQALELGLVDGIIESDDTSSVLPFNKIQAMTERAAFDALANSITTDKPQNKDMNKLQILIMAAMAARGITVAENATEEQVAGHVANALKLADDKVKDLENKLAAKDEERANALVNRAKSEGRLKEGDADGEKQLKDLAMANYSLAENYVSKLPGKAEAPKNVTVNVTTTDTGKETDPSNRESWTYHDYAEKDPAALAKMQADEPEKFQKLVNAIGSKLKAEGVMA